MNILQKIEESTKTTKTELAKILEISKSNYSDLYRDIENGTILSIKKALILAKHFNLSLDEIYEITPTEKAEGIGNHALTLSDEEYDWIEIYSELLRIMGEDYVQTLKKMLQAIIDKNGKLSQ